MGISKNIRIIYIFGIIKYMCIKAWLNMIFLKVGLVRCFLKMEHKYVCEGQEF